MRKPKKILEKKYISSLVIAAFLALSVLTANNIRMGDTQEKESSTEAKETLSYAGNGKDYEENNRDNGTYDEENNSLSGDERTDSDKTAGTAYENNSEEDTALDSKDGAKAEKDQTSKAQKKQKTEDVDSARKDADVSSGDYHYDGKTKLTWPVLGNVILPYSMDTTVYYTTLDQYACNDGVLIAARAGDEVKAAADGRIVNVSESDRYGTVVTVLIGEYYEVYYGQVNNVKYQIGDEVKEGEVIGTVAEPTRSFLLEGPHLFFRMTYKGESVNPTEYLR